MTETILFVVNRCFSTLFGEDTFVVGKLEVRSERTSRLLEQLLMCRVLRPFWDEEREIVKMGLIIIINSGNILIVSSK